MEVNLIGIATLTVVAIIVSLTMVHTMGGDLKGSLPERISEIIDEVSSSISPGKSYNLCEAYSGKTISLKDFQTILQASYDGECGDIKANYTLSFSLTKEDIKNLAKTSNIAKDGELVLYKKRIEPIGAGAIIINGNLGHYPLKKFDSIQLWSDGKPNRDVIINLIEEGCDPYDDDCEIMCSYLSGICDPLCYIDNNAEDVPCDFDCVDFNKDGIINASDLDGVCDLDCYNNRTDIQGAYDIDCIQENKEINDLICDPDTQGKLDGVCDPDCAKPNYICDFDCNGTIYNGNPSGLNDTDCYECDKNCTGFCSYACKEGEDPDCPNGFEGFNNLTECCGNQICGSGENCENCPDDCPTGANCEDLNKVCCPDSFDSDDYGCSGIKNLNVTEVCSCDNQCKENLTCTSRHCCPVGTFWSSSENNCTNRTDVLIVALKSNMKNVYSDAQITQLENKIKNYKESLTQDGLGSIFLYLDEDETAEIAPGGKKVTNPGSWSNINSVLNLLIPKLNATYLVIVGGYSRFPQCNIGSYTGSDTPYGDTGGDNIMDIAVGRFPDPNNGDLSVILNALDTSISLHKNGGLELSSHIAPIMSCGGKDNRNWNSGRCFCSAIWGTSCSACGNCCGCISLSPLSGKDFVVILAHGPGPSSSDSLGGGCLSTGTGGIAGIDTSDSFWMSMACGGGHLKSKSSTSGSITMTFLKNKGAVFIGSTNNNYGDFGGCPVPGGDSCIGSLYTEIAKRFSVGGRIGDAYKEGKNYYLANYHCGGGKTSYHYHINCLYGDPTLKIKKMW